MPWDNSANAGFTTGRPWLPLNADHRQRNIATMAADPLSMLTLYRRLIALRRSQDALGVGAFHAPRAEGNIFSFQRQQGTNRLLVALNMSDVPGEVSLPADLVGRVLLSTELDRAGEQVDGALKLRPAEGVVITFGR